MAHKAGNPLIFRLAQRSYWSALHLGDYGIEQMKVGDSLQEKMVADIMILDPGPIQA